MKKKAMDALDRLIKQAEISKGKVESCDTDLTEIYRGIMESSDKQTNMLENLDAIIDNRNILWPQ